MATQKFHGTTEIESLTVTGTLTSSGAVSGGSPLTVGSISLTDNTTKLTVDNTLEVAGSVLITGAFSGTHIVETRAKASVVDTTYTVAEGVHVVDVSSTGAGGPYAITLGGNNGVNHIVTVFCSAYDTSSFTIASAEGTTTLDAAGESATFVFDGAAWRVVGYHGTTGPA